MKPTNFLVSIGAFRTSVNYDATIEQAISNAQLDWAEESIQSSVWKDKQSSWRHLRNPDKGKKILEIEVFENTHDKEIWVSDIYDELDRMGFRPLTPHELLAFGAAHLDAQQGRSVSGLGSTMQMGALGNVFLVLSAQDHERLASCTPWDTKVLRGGYYPAAKLS